MGAALRDSNREHAEIVSAGLGNSMQDRCPASSEYSMSSLSGTSARK